METHSATESLLPGNQGPKRSAVQRACASKNSLMVQGVHREEPLELDSVDLP